MSHDKVGPNELRLRELRQEREQRTKAPRKLIPYAGKDNTVPGRGRKFHHPWGEEGEEEMIVGIKTVRFITVQRHTNRARGFHAIGIEDRFELHATKGWKHGRRRRQFLGGCERRDMHRAATQGASVSFKLNTDRDIRDRGVAAMPITEKMLMRHGWYRRQKEREARAAATEAWNNA